MADFLLSDEARADLDDIYRYGYQTFGEVQADRYAHGLFRQFELLASFPGMGLPLAVSGHAFLKFWFGTHMIVYTITDDKLIRIESVMDGQTDFLPRLSGRYESE